MSKKNILNLILFIVVVLLAAIIYFSEEENTQLERLTDIDISTINTITIRHHDRTTTIVKNQDKKHSNQWLITEPISIAANDFRINSILKLINAPVHSRYALNEIHLSHFGLDNPETTIKFNNQIIAVGTMNPATRLRYIKLNNFVYSIVDVYYPLISSHFGALVSLNLLPADSNINKLVLVNQTISKDDKDSWQSDIEISADNINKIIDYWQHEQAFGVHEYIKRDKLGEVSIYIDNQEKPISYLIVDTDPWLIIARPEIGLEYHLNLEAYDNLMAPK